jgi:D-alanyl-D-alanine carboxypeptidase
MRKLFPSLIIVLFYSLTFLSCDNSTGTTDSETYTKIYKAVDSIRMSLQTTLNKDIPSLSVLITTPSEEIFVSSVSSNGTSVTKDTYFRFASNTKNFTSASILNMQEDGWLDINSKVIDTIPGSSQTYVPSTPEWNIPNKNDITIKELLQHSAGIYDVSNDTVPGYPGGSYVLYMLTLDPNHQFTSTELINVLSQCGFYYFAPGTNNHYSNTGYTILSEIIARVYSYRAGSSKLYSDYIYDYVTGGSSPVPLGVRFPYLATDNQLPLPNTPGKIYYQDGTITNTSVYNKSPNVGEGNGYGTMSMLKTYIRSMITGANVLSPATVNLMKNEISPGSPNYALGCTLFTNLGYGHTGATFGYFSCMFYDPLTGVSVIGMIPVWDLTNNGNNFNAPFYSMLDACWAARSILGYAGKPETK